MISLKHYEDSAVFALHAYYTARRTASQHKTSAGLARVADRKRGEALKKLKLLKEIEIERGVKL